MRLTLTTLNLQEAERRMCVEALRIAGSITGAAALLKIDRHALARRVVKLGILRPELGRSPPRRPLALGPALMELLDRFAEALSGRELELYQGRIFGASRSLTLQALGRRWRVADKEVHELEKRLLLRLGEFLLHEVASARS